MENGIFSNDEKIKLIFNFQRVIIKISMKLNLQLFVLCCCVYLSLTVPTLDEDIGQTIFHESTFAINADKTYTLYIYEN